MPSFLHNAFVQLLRNHPELVPELLQRMLGVAVPAHSTVRVCESVLDQLAPVQLSADAVVALGDGEVAPKLGVIVEVQLDVDEEKLDAWPVYHALLRRRLRCPVCVLVVTPSERVAAWASKAIDLGPGNENFRVLVLGPQRFPQIVEVAEVAENPALAILTTLAHGNKTGGVNVLIETMNAVPRVDSEGRELYFELIRAALSEPLRQALKKAIADMQASDISEVPPLPDWYRDYILNPEGFARLKAYVQAKRMGKIEGLLQVVDLRGIQLSPEQRRTIESCLSEFQIEQWVARAMTARTADELFASDDASSSF